MPRAKKTTIVSTVNGTQERRKIVAKVPKGTNITKAVTSSANAPAKSYGGSGMPSPDRTAKNSGGARKQARDASAGSGDTTGSLRTSGAGGSHKRTPVMPKEKKKSGNGLTY